jgi:hypothetical protein
MAKGTPEQGYPGGIEAFEKGKAATEKGVLGIIEVVSGDCEYGLATSVSNYLLLMIYNSQRLF